MIKVNNLQPGGCARSNQFEYIVKGKLPHIGSNEDLNMMYYGGTIFVDHTSNYISVYHQVSLEDMDTVWSNELYKKEAVEYGVDVVSYTEDNGVYICKSFNEDIIKRKQTLKMMYVGAHG